MKQFLEWHAYYLAEPWGDDWVQAGQIAMLIHNSNAKRAKSFKHFVPKKPKPAFDEQAASQLEAQLIAHANKMKKRNGSSNP